MVQLKTWKQKICIRKENIHIWNLTLYNRILLSVADKFKDFSTDGKTQR